MRGSLELKLSIARNNKGYYFSNILMGPNIIFLNDKDMEKMGILEGDTLLVKTGFSAIRMVSQYAKIPSGMAVISEGLAASILSNGNKNNLKVNIMKVQTGRN